MSPPEAEKIPEKDQTRDDKVQCTLAIIKPSAIQSKEAILEIIKKEGFLIVEEKLFQMDLTQAQLLYREHEAKDFYKELTEWMSSAPVYAMILEKQNAVQEWKYLIGPINPVEAKTAQENSIRALFGTDELHNAIHGSKCFSSAEKEINIIFGNNSVSQEESSTTENQEQTQDLKEDKEDEKEQNSSQQQSAADGHVHLEESTADSAPDKPETIDDIKDELKDSVKQEESIEAQNDSSENLNQENENTTPLDSSTENYSDINLSDTQKESTVVETNGELNDKIIGSTETENLPKVTEKPEQETVSLDAVPEKTDSKDSQTNELTDTTADDKSDATVENEPYEPKAADETHLPNDIHEGETKHTVEQGHVSPTENQNKCTAKESTSSTNSENTEKHTISRGSSSTVDSTGSKKSPIASKLKKPNAIKNVAKTDSKKTLKKPESAASRLTANKKPGTDIKKLAVKSSSEEKVKSKPVAGSSNEKKLKSKPAANSSDENKVKTKPVTESSEEKKPLKTAHVSRVAMLNKKTAEKTEEPKKEINSTASRAAHTPATDLRKKTRTTTTQVKKTSPTTIKKVSTTEELKPKSAAEKRPTHRTLAPNSTATKKVISKAVQETSPKNEVAKKPVRSVKVTTEIKKESPERKRIVKKDPSKDSKKDEPKKKRVVVKNKDQKPKVVKDNVDHAIEEHKESETPESDEIQQTEKDDGSSKDDELPTQDQSVEESKTQHDEEIKPQEHYEELEAVEDVAIEEPKRVEEQEPLQETSNNEAIIVVENADEKDNEVESSTEEKELNTEETQSLIVEHLRENSRSTEIASIRNKFETLQATNNIVTSQSKEIRSKSPTNRVSDMINRFTN